MQSNRAFLSRAVRWLARQGVDQFIDMASAKRIRVRTPEVNRLHSLLGSDRATLGPESDALEVHGLSSEQVGDLAFRHGIPIHELTPQQASLEEAFMNLTTEAVEFASERSSQEGVAA